MHGPSGSDIGIASILLSIIAVALAAVGIASGGSSTSGNFALQSSGPNITVVLPATLGAYNCTGVTTASLTAIGVKGIEITGQYAASSINQTNWYQWVWLNIGTSAPATSFGSNQCATPTARWQTSMYFPVTGISNLFSVVFSVVFIPTSGSTYYVWFDIQQRGTGTGHINYRNTGSSSASNVHMVELQ